MKKRPTPIISICWLLFSLITSVMILYASWDHNPQGEFHEGDVIYWSEWLPLGSISFFMTGGFIPLIRLFYCLFKYK